MSIRIIPQDELGSSEKRTADMIPPLLFPRLKNLYNRRAERLRELAENNPLGDYLRFAALIAHAQEVVLYDHPLEMDLTARIKINILRHSRRFFKCAYKALLPAAP